MLTIDEKIRHLMDILDYKNRAQRQVKPLVEAFKKVAAAGIEDPEFTQVLDKGLAHLESMDVSDLVEKLVPLWEEHYSEAEIDALIDFHSSPLGQKVLRTADAMRKRETDVSMRWAQEQVQAASERLKRELGL